MKANIGTTDRVLRIVVGVCILTAGIYYGSWLGAIGLIPLVTALIKWCPLYLPFGFSSCKTGQS